MKKEIRAMLVAACGLLFYSCNTTTPPDLEKIDVSWRLVRNITPGNPKFEAALCIKNNSDLALAHQGWRIYFNLRYHGHDLTSTTPVLKIAHVSGDFFYLTPAQGFKGLAPGDSIILNYEGKKPVSNFQDIPTGLFFVRDTLTLPVALKNPTIVSDSVGMLPEPDPTVLYRKNTLTQDLREDKLPRIFPTPSLYADGPDRFILTDQTIVSGDKAFEQETKYLVGELEKVLGYRLKSGDGPTGTSIILKKVSMQNEAYHLNIDNRRILIEAGSAAGIFYGIQSLKTVLPPALWKVQQRTVTLQGIEVRDTPRFPVRSFMLDVARNFQPKEEILKILETMALYKLNVFHFHLNDDEGWRLEIPGLPELTEVGAKRGFPFDKNQQLHPSFGSGPGPTFRGSGFYTRADYIEIVKFAHARHIRVVPEIESPGHARAAIKSMQSRYDKYVQGGFEVEAGRYLLSEPADRSSYLSNQYFNDNVMNVALPSTYAFIEKVIDEIVAMHLEAGSPLTAVHMAGGEVPPGAWEKSPAVLALRKENPSLRTTADLWKHYFENIRTIVRKRGLSIYGWQELVVDIDSEGKHFVNKERISDDLQVDAWWNKDGNEDLPYKLANTGYRTVMANYDHLYFDLAYAPSFGEPGDAWIGFLDIERIFSFIPYDYYRNFNTDVRGVPHPSNFFDGKERLEEAAKSNIVGMEGALWGESLVSSEIMEYLLVPRLLAFAERCWAPDPTWSLEQNDRLVHDQYQVAWSTFVNVLGKRELPRLDYYAGGIGYRIPPPGATVSKGNVVANLEIPGFVIRYTTDGTDPGMESKVYTGPIPDKRLIKLKAFDQRGRSSQLISILNP